MPYRHAISLCFVLLVAAALLPAVEVLDGQLTVAVPPRAADPAGSVSASLSFTARDAAKPQRTLANRRVAFYLHPYRYSPFLPDPAVLTAKESAPGTWTVTLPACAAGWYYLAASVSTVPGEAPGRDDGDEQEAQAGQNSAGETPEFDLDPRNARAGAALLCVRAAGGAPAFRVHAERGRCVFAQGEQLRLYAGVRGTKAVDSRVELRLAGIAVARGPLLAAAGREASVAFDLPPSLTAALPPGPCDLILLADGREADRLPVMVVVPEPASARARWWHGFPFGMASGNTPAPIHPRQLRSYRGWIEGQARAATRANLWINWFSDGTPVVPAGVVLPLAGAADAPPVAAEQRPAAVHALYEMLMANGMACGAMLGGAEGGPENYCPFPTIIPGQIAQVARKYQQAALSLAGHPNFTAVYLDAYGRPDWQGRGGQGDMSEDEVKQVREATWEAGWKAAGAKPPAGAEITLPNLPEGVAPPETRYRFIDFVMRGQERMYGAATRAIAAVLPAAFTIENHNRENHRQPFVYAWRDWARSPSIAPDFLQDAATVIASSEWNLDAEPQAYLLSSEVHRVLLDRGRPVWRTAAFHFNGSSGRFLRDAVHLSGRGITPFYEQPESATWSFQGADQTAFAAKDRLAAVNEFLTTYEGLFERLEPVREVAFYLRPGWGDDNSLSLITGLPAAMMTGHQAHILTIAGLLAGDLAKYKVLFAPGLTGPCEFPAEAKAIRDWAAKGGRIIGAPADTGRYRDLVDLSAFGIQVAREPQVDGNGKPKLDRDGKQIVRETYTETPAARAAATKAAVWKDVPNVEVLPVDFADQWAYLDEQGKPAGYSKRAHWTGFQMWANAAVPALANAAPLKAALDAIERPLVVKDRPEVLVHAMRPKDGGAQGLFLFAANFTVPKEKTWTEPRVPYFFWPTYSAPTVCRIGVKDDGIGVVYDLLRAKPLPIERKDGRVWFDADLTQVEGRVFACYPAAPAEASLGLPARAAAGELLQGTWKTTPAGVLTSVRMRLLGAGDSVLAEQFRAVGPDGRLPALRVPAGADGTVRVEVLDTISGLRAVAAVTVAAPGIVAAPAAPVTVFRGDAVKTVLAQSGLRIAICPGRESWGKDGRKLVEPNAQLQRDRAAAEQLRSALATAGVKAEVADPASVVAGELSAYPFSGAYRSRNTIPNRRIDGPVIVIGSLASNAWLADMERAQVAPRSLAGDNAGEGRAVVAFAPRAFSPEADAVLVVAEDPAGFAAAATSLAGLVRHAETDAFYQAREAVRASYAPRDVVSYKTGKGEVMPASGLVASSAAAQTTAATASGWAGCGERLGPPVFALCAGPAGVATSLCSLGTPAALVSAEGKVVATAGGAGRVWARDVGLSADGRTLLAGLGLSAETVAVGADGKVQWRDVSGVVHKDDAFGWETWKDSERFLAVAPDRRSAVVSAGPQGVVCRDLGSATGAVRWRVPSDIPRDRPRGMPCEEMAYSADGSCVLVYRQKKTGETPVLDKKGQPRLDAAGKPQVDEQFAKEAVLVDAASGTERWHSPVGATGDWDLYNVVGPKGQWTISTSRGLRLAVRDAGGAVVRAFTAEQLPSEFAGAAGSIPIIAHAGLSADRVVLSRAETRTLCIMQVKLGTPAQRTAAIAALGRLRTLREQLGGELQDGGKQGKWDPAYVDGFLAPIALPPAARTLVGDKMKRFVAEARAGRRRNFSWIQDEFETAMRMAFDAERPVIEAACDLAVQRRIALPAMLHAATVAPDLATIYAGLWDGTVRAYDAATGTERWRTTVVGGCQLGLYGSDLYAGGTRGDLWRLDAASGKAVWRVNLGSAMP